MKELSFCHKLKYSYPISLQPNVDLRYFKLLILLDQINIKGLHHQVAKIWEWENLSVWQKLNSFTFTQFACRDLPTSDWTHLPLVIFLNSDWLNIDNYSGTCRKVLSCNLNLYFFKVWLRFFYTVFNKMKKRKISWGKWWILEMIEEGKTQKEKVKLLRY